MHNITSLTFGRNKSTGVLLCVLLSFALSSLWARPVGKFSYRGAPEDLIDSTLIVSDTMVAMAEKIYVPNTLYTGTIVDTPAICFVIDHSGSMMYNQGKNDSMGYRYVVASALTDTIFKKFPTAEVGYVIFGTGLFFLYADQPDIFAQYTGARTNDAYMPLKVLNQTYGSTRGLELLKNYLQLKPTPDVRNNTNYYNLLNQPSQVPGEATNITLAFNAAKKALEASSRSNNSKYIIFMSDGDQTEGGTGFIQGTNCPTTFTIFFTSTGSAPTSLTQMTQNIRTNNFSTTNTKSNLWPFQVTNFNALMSFVRDSIYSTILTSNPANPKQISVGSQTVPNWSTVDSSFSFGSLFPLVGQVTPFNFLIRYGRSVGDTVHAINFNVRTEGGLARSWRNGYEVKLWDRSIVFQNTAGIDISDVTRENDEIQIRFNFDPREAGYTYTRASIELINTHATVRDREVVALTKGTGNFFTGRIRRTVASSATANNNLFEHPGSGDTLIAIFRNSEPTALPLDTLRERIALRITPNAGIVSAATKDNNGNGFIDAINLTFNYDTSVTSDNVAGFTVQYGSTILPVIGVELNPDRNPAGNLRQWRLRIQEPTVTDNVPLQTSWTPVVKINNALLPRIDNQAVTCKDSCAPVILKIKKFVNDQNDRRKDTVYITFSEKIRGATLAPFSISEEPQETFRVWWGNTTTPADSLLEGITYFVRMVGDSILIFNMANGKDLTDRNWMNINALPMLVRDNAGNAPATNNRKVKVDIETITIIKTFPNPAIVTRDIIDIGPDNNKNVVVEVVLPNGGGKIKDHIKNQGTGTMILIGGLKVIPQSIGLVKMLVKINDVAGNSVAWLEYDNLFATPPTGGSASDLADVHTFWNGINSKGMKSAPGVYRATVYIKYPPKSFQADIKTVVKLGLQH